MLILYNFFYIHKILRYSLSLSLHLTNNDTVRPNSEPILFRVAVLAYFDILAT